MPPVRKKPGGSVVAAIVVRPGGRCGGPARGGNLDQSADVVVGSEDDHAGGAPRAAAGIRRLRQRNRRTSCRVDLLQFPAREEGEVAAIRRPEGKAATLASLHGLRGGRIERPNPQLASAILTPRKEYDTLPVRRERHRATVCFGVKRRFLRRQNGRAHHLRFGWRLAEMHPRARAAAEARTVQPKPKPAAIAAPLLPAPRQAPQPAGFSSAIRASPMACNRCLRSLARAAAQDLADGAGRIGGELGPVGSLLTTASSTSGVVAPGKARLPASISYSTAPNEKISLRRSAARPTACSGDMYAAVPRMTPARVCPIVSVGEFAMEKAAARLRAPSPGRNPGLSRLRQE